MTPPATLTVDQLLEERQWLGRLCSRLVTDAAEADDLAQEAMVRALGATSAASAHADGKLRGWLTSTVRNVSMETRRRAGRRRGREISAAQHEHVEVTPETALAGAELREQLARLVLALPREEREAVVLRYYEGLPPAEIAARLDGVSVGAVRQRIYRGMSRLRTALDAESEGGRRHWLPAAVALVRRSTSATAGSAAGTVAANASFGWVLPTVAALLVAACLGWALQLVLGDGRAEITTGLQQVAMTRSVSGAAPEDVIPLVIDRGRELLPVEALPTAGPRSFRILDPRTGDPLEGADWYALATGVMDPEPFGGIDPEYLPPPDRLASGVTSAEGILEVPAIEDDLYQLIVCRGQGLAAGSFAIDARGGTSRTMDLMPPLGSGVFGRFVDQFGVPLAGAELMEYDLQEVKRAAGVADAEGRFQIYGMGELPRQLLRRADGAVVHTWAESSGYYVRVSSEEPWVRIPTWRISEMATDMVAGADVRDLGDVVVVRPRIFRGKVVDEKGLPVANALLGYGGAHDDWAWRSHASMDPKVQPWDASAAQSLVKSDRNGDFELSVFRPYKSAFSRPEIVALAPDGRKGTLQVPEPKAGEPDQHVTLKVSGDDVIRLALEDRLRPGRPLDLPREAPSIASWRKLQTLRGTPLDNASTSVAVILGDGVVSLPQTGLRRGSRSSLIALEVPGFEVAEVEVLPDGELTTVSLDRRARRRVKVRFPDGSVLPHGRVNLMLVSDKPDPERDLGPHRYFRTPWPKTSYAGGLAVGLTGDATIELAWPQSKPAWIVVFSDPAETHATPEPMVVGPLFAPENGTTLDIELEPWIRTDKWGEPDLSRSTTVPLY